MINLLGVKSKIKSLTKKKYLFPCLIVLLLIPLISEAFIVGEVFALFEAKLSGLSELVGPVVAFLVFLVVYLLTAGLALSASTSFLEFASDPSKVNIMGSEAVQVGWQFTSSLANIAIILGLVVIGIATILGKEQLEAKKTLPRLIIAALLVNFSLVFVGAFVDLSQILMRTFYTESVVTDMSKNLWTTWDLIWGQLTGYLGSMALLFVIPFRSPFAQFNILHSIFVTGAFLPNIVEALVSATITFGVSLFFLIYGILFTARIFVLQILAIFSPLAFVAWALPTTKKYFDRWFDVFIQWIFLGIILFFFLLLGNTIIAPLQPERTLLSNFTPSWLEIQSILYYYLFLAIYLGVTAYIAKKSMPTGSQAIINGVKSGMKGFKKGAAPIVAPQWKKIKGEAAKRTTKAEIEEAEKRLEQQEQSLGTLGRDSQSNYAGYASNKMKLNMKKAARKISTSTGRRPERVLDEMKKDNKDLWFDGASEEEVKEILNSDKTPSYRKPQAIEKLQKLGADLSEISDEVVKYWKHLPKDIKKNIEKANPGIHLKLDPVNGESKMKEVMDKKSGSDMRDINWDKMSARAQEIAVGAAMRDDSKMKSIEDSNLSTKKSFMKAVNNVNDSEAADAIGSYRERIDGNEKRENKWADKYLAEMENIVRNFNTKQSP